MATKIIELVRPFGLDSRIGDRFEIPEEAEYSTLYYRLVEPETPDDYEEQEAPKAKGARSRSTKEEG